MKAKKNESMLLEKLLEKGKVYANKFFVILDCPDELMDYFFVRFYSKNNDKEQNDSNLDFFRLLLVVAYFNICMFFCKKSDLKDHFNDLFKQSPLKEDNLFEKIDFDFLETYEQIDNVLISWDYGAEYKYHDLVSFITRNMDNLKVPYQTALGLWFVYNLTFSQFQLTQNDIKEIAPLFGSYAISAAFITRFTS